MRILYPLLWSNPNREACWAQAVNTVAALARLGHEMTLMMPRPAGAPALSAASLRDYFQVEGDFSLVQRPSRWAGGLLPASMMWLRQVFADTETRAAELLYSRAPAMLVAGQNSPLPFATDHYRPWPDQIRASRPLIRRTAAAPHCAGIILHSGFAAEAYRRCGVADERLLVAHNGANPAGPRLEKAAARAATGLAGDRPIALYAGRINRSKGIDQLLAMARLLPEWLFVLVGSEGDGEMEREARRLPNILIVPWQTEAALPVWLQAADALLIPPSRAPLTRFGNCVMPIKVFSYLAAGRPILAPVAPDTAELLRDGENALLVPPDDAAAAAAALRRLLSDGALARRLGEEARTAAQELTWDGRARTISQFLETRLDAIGGRNRCRSAAPVASGDSAVAA